MKIRRVIPDPTLVAFVMVPLLAIGCESPQEPSEQVNPDAERVELDVSSVITFDDRLAAAMGPDFAGLYVAEDGVLTIRSTSNSSNAREMLDRLSHYLPDFAASVVADGEEARLEGAEFSFTDLARWRGIARSAPLNLRGSRVVSLDINERTNRLDVGVASASDVGPVADALVAAGVPSGALTVHVEEAIELAIGPRSVGNTPAIGPRLATNTLLDKIRPVVGGLLMAPEGCTLGFNAYWGASRVVATASHCSGGQGGVQGGEYWQPTTGVSCSGPPAFGPWEPLGTCIGLEVSDPQWLPCNYFGVTFYCRYSDAALIDYYSGVASDLARIARTTGVGSKTIDPANPRWIVIGETTILVGQNAHRVGRTTGYQFGEVTNTCKDFVHQQFIWLCSTEYDAPTAGGDSGSPVFRVVGSENVRLAGIHFAGSSDNSIYSPIDQIRQEIATGPSPLTTY